MSQQLTPELKAKELIENFHQAMYAPIGDGAYTYTNRAKQCAIIAVKELIEVAWWSNTFLMKEPYLKSQKQYWESVLKELEKM